MHTVKISWIFPLEKQTKMEDVVRHAYKVVLSIEISVNPASVVDNKPKPP